MDELEVYSWRREDLLDRYRLIRSNCAERKAKLPPPPDAFRRRLDELLAEAHAGALIAMPNAFIATVRVRDGKLHVVRRGRRCVGCGCDFDDRSAGCRVCTKRHGFRRHAARLAAAA